MRLSTSPEPELTIVHFATPLGSADLDTLAWLEAELDIVANEFIEAEYLILDLSRVHYVGAAFLSVLVRLRTRLGKRGCRLVLAASGFTADMIRVTNLDHLMVTLSSLEAAIHWCRTREFALSDSARPGFLELVQPNSIRRDGVNLPEISDDTIILCRMTVRSRAQSLPLVFN